MKKTNILIFVVLMALLFWKILESGNKEARNNVVEQNQSENEVVVSDNQDFVLDGYPIEVVPLFEMSEISSMKFFVNDEPVLGNSFVGSPVNYYNVVFESKVGREEIFDYYRSLMSEVDQESGNESRLGGVVGDYKVVVSHYGEDSRDCYLQVYLPSERYSKVNPFFGNYPDLVEVDESWIERESSYGKLNQNGGEEEYAQYFVIDEDKLTVEDKDDVFGYFYGEYVEKYEGKNSFWSDDEKRMIMWDEDDFKITMVFEKDHDRIYVMMRKKV